MVEISWNTIKTQYPTAHKMYAQYIDALDLNNATLYLGKPINYKNYVEAESRFLYNFFEITANIAVDVQIDQSRVGYGYPIYAWVVIDFVNENVEKFKELERSRLEAEMIAFESAFKVLEKRNNG